MPFAEYDDMDDCKRAHSDKDDPGAYCAEIYNQANGHYPSQKSVDEVYDDAELVEDYKLEAMAEAGVEPTQKKLRTVRRHADEVRGGGGPADVLAELLDVLDRAAQEAGEPAVKVYVPEPSCVPPGPSTRRDEGGWYYTMTLEELDRCDPPPDYVDVVPPDEVLYSDGGTSAKAERLVESVAGAVATKSWIPYTGPQGGEGWQNVDTGEISYDDQPPGEALDAEDIAEAALDAGVAPGEIEDVLGAVPSPSGRGGYGRGEEAPFDEVLDLVDGPGLERGMKEVLDTQEVDEVYDNLDMPYDDPEVFFDELEEELLSGDAYLGDPEAMIRKMAVEGGVDPEKALPEIGGADRNTDAAQRALGAVRRSQTHKLSNIMEARLDESVARQANNAVDPDIAEAMADHVGYYAMQGFNGSSSRASHRGIARRPSGDPDAGSEMSFGENGSSIDTVMHEFAHALADSYGYDYQSSGGVAQNYSSWDHEFDFGGEHPEKEEFMLTDWGRMDNYGDQDWSDYEGRAEERLESVEDADVGDRVAVRTEVLPDTTDLETGERVTVDLHGDEVEGEITKSVSDTGWGKPMFQPDDEGYGSFALDPDQLVGVEDRDLEEKTVEASVAPNSRPAQARGVDNLEKGERIHAIDGEHTQRSDGVFGRIEEDLDLYVVGDDLEDRTSAFSVRAHDGSGNEYWVDETKITDAGNSPDVALRRNDTGGLMPASQADSGDAALMRSADDRDWVSLSAYGKSKTLHGQSVRFRFGTDGSFSTGTVIDENGAQVLVDTGEEEKWVNRGETFQQTVQVAEDQSEFRRGEPSDSPPGLQAAAYQNMDFDESDIDWDTYARYRDDEENLARLANDDLILVEVGRDDSVRVPARVNDILHDGRLQVSYPPDAAEELREKTSVYNAVMPDSDGGDVRLYTDEFEMVGHAPVDQFVDDEYADIDVPNTNEPIESVSRGDVIEWTASEGAGSERVQRGAVTGFGNFESGDAYVEVRRGDGNTEMLNATNYDLVGRKERGGGAGTVKRNIQWSDIDPDDIADLEDKEVTVQVNMRQKSAEVALVSEDSVLPDYDDPVYMVAPNTDGHETYKVYLDKETGNMVKAVGARGTDDPRDLAMVSVDGGERLFGARRFDGDEYPEPGDTIQYDDGPADRVGRVESVGADGSIHTDSGEALDPEDVSRVAPEGSLEEDPGLPEASPETDRERVERLVEECNKAWYSMATDIERDGRTRDYINSKYSTTNPHETLAMMHQTMQADAGGRGHNVKDVAQNHPDLLDAYLDVFEPSDEAKTALNEQHRQSYSSPFDSEPFPEVGPTRMTVDDLLKDVNEGAEFGVPPSYDGHWGVFRGVVEGEALYEDEDGNEWWIRPEDLAEAVPGVEVPPDLEVIT